LLQDPDETVNLAEKLPDLAEQLENRLDAFVKNKLNGRPDPMMVQIHEAQLPFRRRIEIILSTVGLTWESWIADPQRERYDTLERALSHHGK
ncbi:MAG: sulfatase, partial [Paenibacillus sp.]|nr:sulfatase [Paenibacillus sp.]